jgi:hypothetical protein
MREWKAIISIIVVNRPFTRIRVPAPRPDVSFLFLQIQGNDMIGIDILFTFFAVKASGSDGNITTRRRKQSLFFSIWV